MRVIAGQYKGAKLISPRGEVRPTTDLVKGSLFSMLESKGVINGARCLDLFCGSGALGIEALSRGAQACVFADILTQNVSVNLDKLKIAQEVVRGDFRYAIRLLRDRRFDLVLCDPPYRTDYAEQAYKLLVKYGMLSSGGIVVLEHSATNELKNIPRSCIIEKRTFGAAAFALVGGGNESDICGSV